MVASSVVIDLRQNPTAGVFLDWYAAPALHTMAKRFPIHPAHPERNCWGCDLYCPRHSLACGNGSDRTQHPSELFGPDWDRWESGRPPDAGPALPTLPMEPAKPQPLTTG